MRKYLLLCLVLIASCYVYSQNTSTITITNDQLKTATLIFAEHQKLLETVPLLNNQISNLELINKSWERTDSIRKTQLTNYSKILRDKERSIEDLNKSLKRKQNVIKYGTVSSCVLILLCLLVK